MAKTNGSSRFGGGSSGGGGSGGGVKDKRFRHMHTDPRFRKAKRQQTRIEVDSRFRGLVEDDDFSMGPQGTMDK